MLTKILDFSTHHRALMVGLVLLATIFSVAASEHLELDAIPDLTETQVIIVTEWMGQSPTLIEDQVTYPLTSSMLGAPKVTDVRGYSMPGMSFVYVLFEGGTDLYWARSRVLELLASARGKLPSGVVPALGPDATGIGWVFEYVLEDESHTRGLDELRALQDYTLRYALGSVEGVAEVASCGGYERQYQVELDPERMRALGVSLDEVAKALSSSNGEVGGRLLEASGSELFVRGRGFVRRVSDVEQMLVRKAQGAGGAPLRVADVGKVRLAPMLRRGVAEWNGRGEAVSGIVVMRAGENAHAVIKRVKQKLHELAPSLPSGVKVRVAYDRSALIERTIDTLKKALLEEILVVCAITVLFLWHLKSALLPVLSLPIAVLLSLAPMVIFDIPATIMSLGGIAIAIGATVDAELVMIEAAHKALEHARPGEDRAALLRKATFEVTPAIFLSLLIIAVSFLPVLTLEGQAGKLFRPLALTKTFVMLASALLSITFAPALRDYLISGTPVRERDHPLSRLILRVYEPFVYVALRKPKSTIAIGLFAMLSALPLLGELGEEFMPPLDEGDILYMPTTLPGISIESAKSELLRQDRIIKTFPEVISVFGKIGRAETATDPAPLSMVETTVRLVPREHFRKVKVARFYDHAPWAFLRPLVDWALPGERPITLSELTREMDRALKLPGWTNAWTLPIRTRIDMQSTGIRTPVGIKVTGHEIGAIDRAGQTLERILRGVPGTRSVIYEDSLGGTYVDVIPDRAKLLARGVAFEDVMQVVELGIGGAPIGTVLDGRARIGLSVRFVEDARSTVDRIKELPLVMAGAVGADAAVVRLGDVAQVETRSGPAMVRDEDGMLAGYVYVDVDTAATDLGGYVERARARVSEAIAKNELDLSHGLLLKWSGQYEQLEALKSRLSLVLPLTLLAVVALLYLQFRNMIEVLIIMLSIPFALVGSIWLMWLLDYRLSTASWVGVIALVGLATQTGVVMILYIDAAFEKRKARGLIRNLDDIVWAHMEGTVQRVRPKLMTISAMLLGLVPLLWAEGSGADVMKRIAAPMVGGLLTSAFLTLEIIPVIYTYWRYEELVLERLAVSEPGRHRALLAAGQVLALSCGVGLSAVVLPIYVDVAAFVPQVLLGAAALSSLLAAITYAYYRRGAARALTPALG